MKELGLDKIEKCVALIQEADCVLVGAGAGMSAAAGIDYTDPVRFARLFPMMHQRGFNTNYELMGYRGLSDEIMWGYHAMHVQHVAYDMQEHPVYQQLHQLVSDKDYFVMTSNIDRMFYKNHFDASRIYTPQGDYTLMQCLQPCTEQTWDTRPFLDRLLNALDMDTHEVTDPDAIPRCPNCGGAMFMNVRGGNWFIEKPYQSQRQRLQEWINKSLKKKLVLLEFGAGFNTPGVIRFPLEQITHHHPNATLIRFNRDYPQVPDEIRDKSISVKDEIDSAIKAIYDKVTYNKSH